MRTISFDFKEDKHVDFFMELLIAAGVSYVEAKKRLDDENMSLRSAHPALEERKRLENKISELENKLNDIKSKGDQPINKIDMQFSLEKAQQKLRDAGYVFYKYKKPTAEVFKRRRTRRTKKEMEQAAGLIIRK